MAEAHGRSHALFMPVEAWGHLRPMILLAINLLDEDPRLCVTFLSTERGVANMQAELASPMFAHIKATGKEGSSSIVSRLQILVARDASETARTGQSYSSNLKANTQVYVGAAARYAPGLVKGEAVLAGGEENVFGGVKASAVIFDGFHQGLPQAVSAVFAELGLQRPKLLSMVAFSPAFGISMWGGIEHGGLVAREVIRYRDSLAQGLSEDEALAKEFNRPLGEVLRIAGVPEIYDYEWRPMSAAAPSPMPFQKYMLSQNEAGPPKEIDAYVQLNTVPEHNSPALEGLAKAMGREVVCPGPQYPPAIWEALDKAAEPPASSLLDRSDPAVNDEQAAVLSWLGTHPTRSVVYVSLGSGFFPHLRPELVTYLIDSTLSSGLHVLVANPASLSVPAVFTPYADDHRVLVSRWAPQWRVLHDPAVAFFVTHAGANSTVEAMMAGVPIVAMPLLADQPVLALQFCSEYRAGIELLQNKTMRRDASWPADKPFVLRRGVEVVGTEKAIKAEMIDVCQRMMGPEGERARENMVKLRGEALRSRESGLSRAQTQRLLEMIR